MGQGTLFIDIEGTELSDADRRLLENPRVGGVILFGRNTLQAEQTARLSRSIHALRDDLVVSIDQEGGRVQRLREGVTRLPPMAALGRVFQRDENEAVDSAREVGYLMAAELRLLDVDVSFAPVLDVDYGRNSVIGDRAFACDAQQISALAAAFIAGMREAGMAAAGKHFPGHGWADADTHHKDALDNRSFDEIWQQDLVPFRALIAGGMEGIMPAHVLYSGCSDMPAGFSDFWLRQVLREKLGFDGVIFSDDLSMKAAHTAGGYRQRAEAALVAGCNVLLPCNNREGALEVLAYLEEQDCAPVVSLKQMRGRQFSADVDRMRHGAELCQSLWSEVERG